MSRSHNSRRGSLRSRYDYERSGVEHDRRRSERAAASEAASEVPARGDCPSCGWLTLLTACPICGSYVPRTPEVT